MLALAASVKRKPPNFIRSLLALVLENNPWASNDGLPGLCVERQRLTVEVLRRSVESLSLIVGILSLSVDSLRLNVEISGLIVEVVTLNVEI